MEGWAEKFILETRYIDFNEIRTLGAHVQLRRSDNDEALLIQENNLFGLFGFYVQVYSSRDAVQKEGVVISFMCSIILQMLLLMQIMILGILGDGESVVHGHDQGPGQNLTLPAGRGHIG